MMTKLILKDKYDTFWLARVKRKKKFIVEKIILK